MDANVHFVPMNCDLNTIERQHPLLLTVDQTL